ncbi:MAG: MBOAT family O-acyltransferase [Candidatus Omnitrophota bacterium]
MITLPSWNYFIFLAFVVVVYWRINRFWQNVFLLVASYLFYALWDWRLLYIMIVSTGVVYVTALWMKRAKSVFERRAAFYASIFWSLGVLLYFKYNNFFIDAVCRLWGQPAAPDHGLTIEIILPLGLSFYTLQLLGYTIDVYNKTVEPHESVLDLALFIAFFPKILSGPIERPKNLLVQIAQPRVFRGSQLMRGIDLIVWGLVKKLVVADNIGLYVNMIFALKHPSLGLLLIGGFGFCIQLYADFSGYTDMCRGAGKMLGFDLLKNFNMPFLARTPMDFWNRWHMSFSSWIKDYLFMPLVFKLTKMHVVAGYILAVIISFGLAGLWHGPQWKFVVWGLYFAVLIIFYQFIFRPVLDLCWRENFLTKALAVSITYILVNVGFVLSRTPSLDFLWGQMKHEVVIKNVAGRGVEMAFASSADVSTILVLITVFIFFMVPLLFSLLYQWLQRHWKWNLDELYGFRVFLYTVAGVLLIIFAGINSNDFIYFKF